MDKENAVSHVMERYAAAAATKDSASLMDLYHPDARIFDCWETWSYDNAAAWGVAVRGWFDSLGSESVRVTFDDVRSFVTEELAIASAVVTYAGMSAEGVELRSMQNRITWGIRDSTHGFQIVHEHTSAPIAFEGMKAILSR